MSGGFGAAVQQQFASVPLFDESLSTQLADLERRQLATSNNLPVFNTTAMSYADDTSRSFSTHSYDPQQPALNGQPSYNPNARATFSLPPKIMRPWSLDQLLQRGEHMHNNRESFSHAKVSAMAQPYIPRGLSPSAVRVKKNKRNMTHNRDQRHRNSSPNQADSSDDEYKHGPKHASHTPMTTVPWSASEGDGVSPSGAPREGAFLQQAGPLSPAKLGSSSSTDVFGVPMDDISLEEQIERAATRKRIQEERLRKQGLPFPSERKNDGGQTEAELTRYFPDSHGVVKEKELKGFSAADVLATIQARASATASASQVSAGKKDFNTQTQSPNGQYGTTKPQMHPLVLDAAGYRPFVVASEAGSQDTVWKHMLVEEQNGSTQASKSAKPSAYQLAQYSSAGTVVKSALANTPREEAVLPNAFDRPVEAVPALFETKEKLLRDLDKMQLANEELLVRNRILSTAKAPDAIGSRREYEALSHISDAAARASGMVPAMPPPSGGYSSVMEGPGADKEAERNRWAVANQSVRLEDASNVVAPIRRWAVDQATSGVAGSSMNSSLPIGQPLAKTYENFFVNGAGVTPGYDARKKWGHVSFGGSDTLGVTDLHKLSSTAQDWMGPRAY